MSSLHHPVLRDEVIDLLNQHLPPGSTIIDGTLGNAGHSLAFIQNGYKIIGLDRNSQSLKLAKEVLSKQSQSANIYQDNFVNFLNYFSQKPSAVFLDLGLSTSQLKDDNMGLSFYDDNLDMRLDTKNSLTAKDLVNNMSQDDLSNLIAKISQEKLSTKIAENIVKSRQTSPIISAKQLAEIVKQTYNKYHQSSRLHPATKTFLALKITVNNELDNLKIFLQKTLSCPPNFLVVILTFHSTEDRLVKNFVRQNTTNLTILKAIFPSNTETLINPPSRSAILRSYIIKPCL